MRIRYITGRNGNLNRGLSADLQSVTDDYEGLATDSKLLELPLEQQIAKVHGCDPPQLIEFKFKQVSPCVLNKVFKRILVSWFVV